MKKVLIFLFFCLSFGFLKADNDCLAEDHDRVVFSVHSLDALSLTFAADTVLAPSHGKDPVIAWLINFPAGMLGLHRLYLGAKPKVVLWYIISLGGVFGIVPMVDWILLLQGIQKKDITPYVGNSKFLMWL